MNAAHAQDTPEIIQSDRLRRKIGLGMAAASTVFGILYLLGIGVNLVTSGSVYPSGSDVRFISAVIALLWNIALVALFTVLRREAQPSKGILAELALVFAVLTCAASCASWFAGITAYPRLARLADPSLAAFLDPYNPASITYALEHLGWGLFFGLATVLAGLALGGGAARRWLAWSLVATGALSLGHFLGVLAGVEALVALGYIAWGVFLPVSSVLIAGMYRRLLAGSASS